MIGALIKRDITIAFRSGGAWLLGVIFFGLFLTLCAIGFGGKTEVLRELASALVWLAALFSALLSFSQILSSDKADGSLEQLLMAMGGATPVIIAKFFTYLVIGLLPIWIAIPIAGLLLGLGSTALIGLGLSLLCAAPAIAAYGILASALTVSRGAGGFLVILITAPFLIPLLIFGIAAAENFAQHGIMALEFRALIGLSLIAITTALPAAAVALKSNFE